MDWKDLGEEIAAVGLPLLGAALPIPGGAAIGQALAAAIGAKSADPDEILATLTSSADAIQKAKEFESAHQETILRIQVDAERAGLEAVNKTMQAEASSEHWPSYSWRPYNGFLFGTTIFGCYFVLPLIKLVPPSIPPEIWLAWGSILGVASWFRGKMQADPNVKSDNRG